VRNAGRLDKTFTFMIIVHTVFCEREVIIIKEWGSRKLKLVVVLLNHQFRDRKFKFVYGQINDVINNRYPKARSLS